MRLRRRLCLACSGLLVAAAANAATYTATLTGDQEVPPVVTSATGSCSLTQLANYLIGTCTHNVSNVIASHIHNAPAGVAGGIEGQAPGGGRGGADEGVVGGDDLAVGAIGGDDVLDEPQRRLHDGAVGRDEVHAGEAVLGEEAGRRGAEVGEYQQGVVVEVAHGGAEVGRVEVDVDEF